jgi:hypothetical protein
MKLLSDYILVGLIFMVYFEVVGWYVLKYAKDPKALKAGKAWSALGNYEKLSLFLFWPVSIVVYLIALIRTYIK